MRFLVEPVSEDTAVPPHPVDGPIDPYGSSWVADQYTIRLIQDGVIRRKPDEPVEAPADPAPKPSLTDSVKAALGLGKPERELVDQEH